MVHFTQPEIESFPLWLPASDQQPQASPEMRAVGAGTNAIRLMFVGEGVLVGLLSFVAAPPLGYPSALLFGHLLGDAIFKQPLTGSLWSKAEAFQNIARS